MIKFLDLQSQYSSIRQEIDEAISHVIGSATFIGGRPVAAFEEDFARYVQADHCIGVANATDGLEIAIEALGLTPGSEILVPANSFVASSEAVTRSGHRVRFVDPDPRTLCVNAETLDRQSTPNTRAVIVVHLYGRPVDVEQVSRWAAARNIAVVEDAAQAHGASVRGRRVGAIGHVGVFSFYPGKNLGAYGDGGAIVTSDPALARRARMIANHGRVAKYDHEFEGRNSRLDSIQAAILSVKLRHLDSWTDRRNLLAAAYYEALSDIPGLVLPPAPGADVRHAYHLFVVRTSRRSNLAAHLTALGIETGIHYPVALPDLAAYAYLRDSRKFMSSVVATELLSLPIGEHLGTEQVRLVADTVRAFFTK